ncbi:phenylacetate--CoA ligase family protein [Fulvivirga sediminis]|uniref:AMP-binding protein n=1 Tax=Fulvivirga sediminis TaxID=2803949 RepID=A0A937F6V7_9BACT|nr:AMP-binding protein [Fulvivirga sediminis]MBL3656825.1 AMP-binding protein [Fulvivirga sediminis]
MFIPSLETLDHSQIRAFQLRELKKLLTYVSESSPFYISLFKQADIMVDDINSFTDFERIPPTDKSNLQQFQKDFWCVSTDKILDYCSTSGTEGRPVIVPLTSNDLDRLAYNESTSLTCANGSDKDIYQLTTTIDRQFMAGYAYALGVKAMGAGMVRVGPGLPELQWRMINEIKPTALIIVPSFLNKIIDYALANDIDFQSSSITKAVCIGEPIRHANFELNAIGKRITEKWNINLYSTYASTEMGTAFTECEAGRGGHLRPELLIAEILDDNNQPVKPGETGELTITTLGVEAMPLIRFKTGDICYMDYEPCSCGRNTSRLSPILGRKYQLIKYKGTTCYPPAIFDLLDAERDILHYQVVVEFDEFGNDLLKVLYCGRAGFESGLLYKKFKAILRVTPELYEVSEEVLVARVYPKTSRKPLKFMDMRK